MATLSLPIVTVIRENVAVLMTYAFSSVPLQTLASGSFDGEFKRLRQALFEMPQQRAERASLELALLLRYLDDEQDISQHFRQTSAIGFGYVTGSDGVVSDLSLREVTNKIIHASSFDWNFDKELRPLLLCRPRDNQKWASASIDIVGICVVCGSLLG